MKTIAHPGPLTQLRMANQRAALPFIEFDETHAGAELHVTLRCAQLPAHMWCAMTVRADGWVEMTTQANGKGSRRYSSHRDYDAACLAARKWATRKVREAARGQA